MKVSGFTYKGTGGPRFEELYPKDAQAFLVDLARKSEPGRQHIHQVRKERQQKLLDGESLDFRPETKYIREASWRVAQSGEKLRPKLRKRVAELTTPVYRPDMGPKMLINAFNAGSSAREEIERVDVVLSCFEDAIRVTEENVNQGLIAIIDAVNGKLSYRSPEGKTYELDDDIANLATLTIRPPGLHLNAPWVLVDGKPVSAFLLVLGLSLFHNGQKLIEKGIGPNYYVPKMQNYEDADWVNEAYGYSQLRLGIPYGTINSTQLIETIQAGFQMNEILYMLQAHSSALNFGRYDYMYDFGKTFMHDPNMTLPPRKYLTMDKHFLQSLADFLVQTCHKREAYALGGMVADVPQRDPEKNKAVELRIRGDKKREAEQGFDGAWLLNPNSTIVRCIKEPFREIMTGDNQLHVKREDIHVTRDDLLSVPKGEVTREDLLENAEVALLYREPWLRGIGAVAIKGKMEDTATDEIVEVLTTQWQRHGVVMSNGETITKELVKGIITEARKKLESDEGEQGKYKVAERRFKSRLRAKEYPQFLPEYDEKYLVNNPK